MYEHFSKINNKKKQKSIDGALKYNTEFGGVPEILNGRNVFKDTDYVNISGRYGYFQKSYNEKKKKNHLKIHFPRFSYGFFFFFTNY